MKCCITLVCILSLNNVIFTTLDCFTYHRVFTVFWPVISVWLCINLIWLEVVHTLDADHNCYLRV